MEAKENTAREDSETSIESHPDSARSTRSQSDFEKKSTLENNYKCPFCPMNLSRYNYLLMHVAKVHFADKLAIEKSQRKCTFCGKYFGAYTNLVSTTILTFVAKCHRMAVSHSLYLTGFFSQSISLNFKSNYFGANI